MYSYGYNYGNGYSYSYGYGTIRIMLGDLDFICLSFCSLCSLHLQIRDITKGSDKGGTICIALYLHTGYL